LNFKNITVSKKVMGAFAVVLMSALVLGIFSVSRLATLKNDSDTVAADWMPSIGFLADMRYSSTRFRLNQAAFAMAQTEEERQTATQLMVHMRSKFEDALARYRTMPSGAQEQGMTDTIQAKWDAYLPTLDKLAEIGKRDGPSAATAYFLGPMKTSFDELNEAIAANLAYNREGGLKANQHTGETYSSAKLLILIALAITIVLCVCAGYVLISGVSKPLGKMTAAMRDLARGNLDAAVPCADQTDEVGQLAAAMTAFKQQLAAAETSKVEQTRVIVESIGSGLERLAAGDLTHRVSADLDGAFARLKDNFNTAIARQQETLQSVLQTTDQIAHGAGEISTAADDLSRRTEQQAANLEETAAALEEITTTVKKTSENTRIVTTNVAKATAAAEDGGRVVETAVQAMDAIAQSSRQIAEIIGVIDEIAFQTNLLALNAGVEAARAGDAGRGFAVVASEVRALAQRASEAAKQIKTLINASGEQVTAGVKFVGDSGKALRRIVEQVTEINAVVKEMAIATEQQASGIEQVNAAVSQMDQVTQQNAAMVEQSTAAAKNLAIETRELTEEVSFFKVGAQTKTKPAPAPSRRPAVKSQRQPVVAATTALASKRVIQEEPGDWTEF
jgi:methyl-accepting chemotaxis protein